MLDHVLNHMILGPVTTVVHCPSQVHFSRIARISSATVKLVTISKAYKDFEDVFSIKKTGHLLLYKDHNHAIDIMDNK